MSCVFYRTVIGPGVIFFPQILQGNENRNSALNILVLLLSSRFIAADSSSTGYTAGTVSDSNRFPGVLQDRNRSRCRVFSSRFIAADSSSTGYRAGTVSDSSRFPGSLQDRNRSRCHLPSIGKEILQGNENRDFGLIILILLFSSRFIAAGSRSTGYTAGTVSD